MHAVNATDGTRIAYDVMGAGPALVYITGAICHRRFQPVVDDVKAFARHYTVYSYDRRGRGDSGDGASFHLQAEVADARAIIEATGGRAFVYGHSSGAVLALETALAHPDKVQKVVAYDAPYVANAEQQAAFRRTEHRVRALVAEGLHADAIRLFLIEIGTPWLVAHLMRLIPGWGRTVQLAPTLLYDIALTSNMPPLDRLIGIKVPTLVLAGEKSPVDVQHVSRSIADAVVGARFDAVPKQGHMVSAKALLSQMNPFFLGARAD